MIYLASPYTHPNKAVEHLRYKATEKHVANLLADGWMVYSPIVHCHYLSVNHNLPGTQDFWNTYNFHMLRLADRVSVLKLGGWDKSVGVAGEIAEAERIGIPVAYLDHNEEHLLREAIDKELSATVE